VIVTPGALARHLERYERNPSTRFVSDGLPDVISVPRAAESRLDVARWPEKEIRVVEEPPLREEMPEAGEGVG
jgi:hypothetical protein